jgi:hypothetical protein
VTTAVLNFALSTHLFLSVELGLEWGISECEFLRTGALWRKYAQDVLVCDMMSGVRCFVDFDLSVMSLIMSRRIKELNLD